jgi:hypothetical protein
MKDADNKTARKNFGPQDVEEKGSKGSDDEEGGGGCTSLMTRQIVGTFHYMAPEYMQVQYALGVHAGTFCNRYCTHTHTIHADRPHTHSINRQAASPSS